MNCQQIDEYLFAYCDGKISPELRSIIDEHLAGCEICQNIAEFTRMENQILSETTGIPILSEDFTSRVMQSVPGRPSTPAGSSTGWLTRLRSYRFYLGGTVAAAVILLALYLPGLISVDTSMDSTNMAERSASSESASDQTANIPGTHTSTLGKSESDSASVTQDKISAEGNFLRSAASPDDNTIETEQKMAPLLDINQDDTTAKTKQDNTVYGLSLPKGLDNADQDFSTAELDLLSLHPNNLPADYKIEKIINTSYNAITYVYRNTVNNESLEITVALADDAVIMKQSLSDGLGAGADQEYIRSEAALLNSANTSISYQGRSFEINLKAVMPLEKLQELANSIKFKEGLPDEPID